MKKSSTSNSLKIITSFLLVAFCFFFPHLGLFPIYIYPFIVLFVLWLYLRFISREDFSNLFFTFRRFKLSSIPIGIFIAVLLSLFFQFLWEPVINHLIPDQKMNLEDFSGIRHHTGNYIFMLVMALLVGGFYEEIV